MEFNFAVLCCPGFGIKFHKFLWSGFGCGVAVIYLNVIGDVGVDIVQRLHSHVFKLWKRGEAEEMSFFVFVNSSGISQKSDCFQNFTCGHENQITRIKDDFISVC